MTKSTPEKVRSACLSAHKIPSTGDEVKDCRAIEAHVLRFLMPGSKVYVMTDAERGYNVVAWLPSGRLVKNKEHRSGYFIIPRNLRKA